MHIAYVTETYPPEINGVALTVARSVAFLRAHGHVVDLIRPAQPGEAPGPVADGWLSRGGPIPMYPDLRWGMAAPGQLARRFAAGGTRLVHVATEGPLGAAAVQAARRLGLVVTSDFRTNFHQYSRHYRLGALEPVIGAYLRWFHNRTLRTFVPTKQTRRELAAAGFDRLRVVGRGVDLQRFDPQRRDPELRRRWLGEGSEGPVLLHVGRLAAEKNVELVVAAFHEVHKRTPGARLVVVGDGPSRAALQHACPTAHFVGPQTGEALATYYASADLFLFPSESETFGNVTLEALASGLAVIAFDLAAAAEHVSDRVHGRLVAAGDRTGFIQACCATAAAPLVLRRMCAAARGSVAGLEWDAVLRGFESELQQALDEQTPSRLAVSAA